MVLICFWAAGIIIFTIAALVEASDIQDLDGYQFFQLGADWGEETRGHLEDPFQFCEALHLIPDGRTDGMEQSNQRSHGVMGKSFTRRRCYNDRHMEHSRNQDEEDKLDERV
jgi:hypothetical protein